MSSNLKKKREKKKLAAQATMEEKKSDDCGFYVEEQKHENNKNHHQEEEEEEEEEEIGDGYCIDDFPPGYRFRPTDEELVKYYLTRKLDNKPLPHDKIKEVFLYQNTPKQLTDENMELGENEWYFFTPRERKYKRGTRPDRKAGDGYWKATGADKMITSKGKLIGRKKSLVFYEGRPPRGIKSEWIMHEYRADRPIRTKSHENDMRLDDWVLCRLKKKLNSANKAKFQEHDVLDANPLAIALEELEEEEENFAQFSQNTHNQASTISSMGEHGGSTMSSKGGHEASTMSSMGGHGGSTMSTGLAYGTTAPHENFFYDVWPMDYNYSVQQNVYIPPPLGYPMGNNNNSNIPPYGTYGQATNYHNEHFDVKHDHMLSTNFACEIQPAHSGVVDDHMLSTKFACDIQPAHFGVVDDHMLSKNFAGEIQPAHFGVVDFDASCVEWADEEYLSAVARLPELTRLEYNPDGSLK